MVTCEEAAMDEGENDSMPPCQSTHNKADAMSSILRFAAITTILSLGTPLSAVELPPELPLWENGSPEHPMRLEVEAQVLSHKAQPGSPSGQNRAFSSVSSAAYSIHRPEKPNGVGLVICPGGGFRDVWIDREGHDLALWPTSFAAWLRDCSMIED